MSGVGEAAAFLGTGALAVLEFFTGPKRPLPEVEDDDAPEEAGGMEDKLESLARKLAPFPGQEG